MRLEAYDFGQRMFSARYFIGDLNWTKAPPEVDEVLSARLLEHQENLWISERRGKDRSQAPVVFLPGQFRISCAKIPLDRIMIAPSERVFDPAEFVVQGLTKEALNVDTQSAYIVGRVQGSNDLVRVAQISQRLSELGFKDRTLIAVSLAFTRKDRPDEEQGEGNTIRAIARMLAPIVSRLITFDGHSIEINRAAFESGLPFLNVSAAQFLTEELGKKSIQAEILRPREKFNPDNCLVVGPDDGALNMSSLVAKLLGVPKISLKKKRDAATGEVTRLSLSDEILAAIKDKFIVIFDDIIASGTTLRTIGDLFEGHVRGILVIATHASYQKQAISHLSKSPFLLVVTLDSRSFTHQPPRGGIFHELSSMRLVDQIIRADADPDFNPFKHPGWCRIVH